MDVLKIPSTALIAEFLTEKGKEIIKRLFYGFESANLVTKFDGVYDKLTLAELRVTKDLIYEYTGTTDFTRTDEALEITGILLETALMKTELQAEVNGEQMRAFRAYLRGANMTMDDMHFVEYLIKPSEEKMQEELENAMWQAVLDTTPGNIGNRKLAARFNGYKKIAKDAGVATNATVVATGAITDANAVDKVHLFFRSAHKTMKKKGFMIFCSYTTFESYQIHYAATHAGRELPLQEVKAAQYSFTGLPLMLGGGKTFLVPVAGWGDDDGLIGTRSEWLAYGFDYEGEYGEWDIQKQGWKHWMLNKFPIGVQVLLKRPGFLLVNDRLP